jgi:hypothetical protein
MAETMDAASMESGVIRIEWGLGTGDWGLLLLQFCEVLGGERGLDVFDALVGEVDGEFGEPGEAPGEVAEVVACDEEQVAPSRRDVSGQRGALRDDCLGRRPRRTYAMATSTYWPSPISTAFRGKWSADMPGPAMTTPVRPL